MRQLKKIEKSIKKIEDLIEGWKITKQSDVVKRFNGEEYAKGFLDGLITCLNVLKKDEDGNN